MMKLIIYIHICLFITMLYLCPRYLKLSPVTYSQQNTKSSPINFNKPNKQSVESKSGRLVEEPGVASHSGSMGTGTRTSKARRRDWTLPNRRFSVPETVMRRYLLSKQRSVSVSGSSGVATVPVGTPNTLSAGSGDHAEDSRDPAAPGGPSDDSGGERPRARRHSDHGPGLGLGHHQHPETPVHIPRSSLVADTKSSTNPKDHSLETRSDSSQARLTSHQSSDGDHKSFFQAETRKTPEDSPPSLDSNGNEVQISPAAELSSTVYDDMKFSPGKADRNDSTTLDQTVSEHSLSTQDMTNSILSDSMVAEISPPEKTEVIDAPSSNQSLNEIQACDISFSNDSSPMPDSKSGKEQDVICSSSTAEAMVSEKEYVDNKYENSQNYESDSNVVTLKYEDLCSNVTLEATNKVVNVNSFMPDKVFDSEKSYKNEKSEYCAFSDKESQTGNEGIPLDRNSNLRNIPLSNETEENSFSTLEHTEETRQNNMESSKHELFSSGSVNTNLEANNKYSSTQRATDNLRVLENERKHSISKNSCSGRDSHIYEEFPPNRNYSPRDDSVDRESINKNFLNSSDYNGSSVYRTSDTSIDMSVDTPTECCITTPETDQMQSMSDGLTESCTITPLGNNSDTNSNSSDKPELQRRAATSTTLDQTVSDRSTSTQDTTASISTDVVTPDGGNQSPTRQNNSTTMNQTVSDNLESMQDMALSVQSESSGRKSIPLSNNSDRKESSLNTTEVIMSTTLDQSVSDNSTSTQDMTLSIKSESSPLIENSRQITPCDKQMEVSSPKQTQNVSDMSTSTQDKTDNTVSDLDSVTKSIDAKFSEALIETLSGENISCQQITSPENLEQSRRHTILSPVRENTSSRQSGGITSCSNSSQDLEHIAFMEDNSPKPAKSNVQSIFYVVKPINNYCNKLNDTSMQNNLNSNTGLSSFPYHSSGVRSCSNTSFEVHGEDGIKGKLESKMSKDVSFQNVLPSKPHAAEFCGTRYYPLQTQYSYNRNKDFEFIPVNEMQTYSQYKMNNVAGISPIMPEKYQDMYNGLPIRSESPSSVLSRTAYNWSHLTDKDKYISVTQKESNWLQNKHQISLAQENISSCFGTGSCYRKTVQTELAIPRYSALPRTVSMLVNTSSGDCSSNSDSDSECLSLVDSLEDTTPSRRAKRSAEKSSTKEDLTEQIPEEGMRRTQRRVQVATPRGMAKAFFVSISENEINDKNAADKSCMVSESMPDKLKDKLSQRHQQLVIKRIEKYYSSDAVKCSAEEGKQGSRNNKLRRYLKRTKPIKEASVESAQKVSPKKLKNEQKINIEHIDEGGLHKTEIKEENFKKESPELKNNVEYHSPQFTRNEDILEENEVTCEDTSEVNVNSKNTIAEVINTSKQSTTIAIISNVGSINMTYETDSNVTVEEINDSTVDEIKQQNFVHGTQYSENTQATQTNEIPEHLQIKHEVPNELKCSSDLSNTYEVNSTASNANVDSTFQRKSTVLRNKNRVKRQTKMSESTTELRTEVTKQSPITDLPQTITDGKSTVTAALSLETNSQVPLQDIAITLPTYPSESAPSTATSSTTTSHLSPAQTYDMEPFILRMDTLHEQDEDVQKNHPDSNNSPVHNNVALKINHDSNSNKLQRSHIPVMKSPIGLHKVNKEPLKTEPNPEVTVGNSNHQSNLRPCRPQQQPTASLRRSANILVSKFQQRFEVIPEEKSGSLESSTEDQNRLTSEHNNRLYMQSAKLPSKSLEINNGTSSNIPILVHGHQAKPPVRRNSNENYEVHKPQQNRRYRNRFSAPQRRNSENKFNFNNSENHFSTESRYEKNNIRKENINEIISEIKNAEKLDNVNGKLIALPVPEHCTCSKGSENKTDNVPEIIETNIYNEKLVLKCDTKTEIVPTANLDQVTVTEELDKSKECYKGKASVAHNSQDSELLSLSKGWINFYLLKGNQGTPEESTTEEGGAVTSEKEERRKAPTRTVSVIGADDGRPRQCTLPARAQAEERTTTLPQIPSSRQQSPVSADGLPLDLSPASPDSDRSTVYLRPPTGRPSCAGSGELACSESSSSSSSSSSKRISGCEREAPSPPLLPLRWPVRQRRYPRLSRSRSRLQHHRGEVVPYPHHYLQQSPCVTGSGWTVTVAGTTACPQQQHDVEMRLSFPACARRQPASQSDSGLGEDNHGDSTHHFLPPAAPGHHWSFTVKNQADGFDGSEEVKNEKDPHQCLPDLTCNTGQLKHTKKIVKRPGTGLPTCSPMDEDTKKARARRRLSLCSWPRVHSVVHGKVVAVGKTSGNASREARVVSQLLDDDRSAVVLESGLAITGSAITPEKKPRVPTMSERDLTRPHLGKGCSADHQHV